MTDHKTAPDPRLIGKGPARELPEDMRDARALRDHMIAHLKSWVADAEPDASWQIMFVACCANGDVVPIVLSDSSEEAKETFTVQARTLFKHWGVTHYVAAVEAWLALASPDPATSVLRPSQREDRREVFMVLSADREGNRYSACLDILRDERTGGIAALEEIAEIGGISFRGAHKGLGGRFADLLDENADPGDPDDAFVSPPDDAEHEAHAKAALELLLDPPDEMRDQIPNFDAVRREGRSLLARIEAVRAAQAKGEPIEDDIDAINAGIREVGMAVLSALRRG